MTRGTTIAIIIVIVVLIGGGLAYWYTSMQGPSYSAPSVPAAYQTPATTTAPMPMPSSTGMNMSSTPAPTPPPAPAAAPSPASAAAVTISNFAFSPATLTVHKGTTVTWTNEDIAPHTVTGDNGGPSSSALSQGKTYSYTFNAVGSFPYHCTIHPYMKATVTVIN